MCVVIDCRVAFLTVGSFQLKCINQNARARRTSSAKSQRILCKQSYGLVHNAVISIDRYSNTSNFEFDCTKMMSTNRNGKDPTVLRKKYSNTPRDFSVAFSRVIFKSSSTGPLLMRSRPARAFLKFLTNQT